VDRLREGFVVHRIFPIQFAAAEESMTPYLQAMTPARMKAL
jgi:hypothetical protein